MLRNAGSLIYVAQNKSFTIRTRKGNKAGFLRCERYRCYRTGDICSFAKNEKVPAKH